MSTKKVIAIVVVTNLIIIAFLLASLSMAGVAMAFPPGPQGLATPEETVEILVVNRTPTIPDPNVDSGWVEISKGTTKRIVHNIGGSVNKYLVNLMCKDPEDDGINQNYYGIDSGYGGVTWWGLNETDIRVYRDPKDTYCDRVRVRIWKTGAPIYEGP